MAVQVFWLGVHSAGAVGAACWRWCDYGGEAALLRVYERGGGLLDFNCEQMGEVVADYFRLLHGYRPLYCRADAGLLPVMKALVERGLVGGGQRVGAVRKDK